jgi:hypothetical protein
VSCVVKLVHEVLAGVTGGNTPERLSDPKIALEQSELVSTPEAPELP